MLSIRLLGAPQILFDGQPVQLARRKSRALIYYLAAHPSPLARERLLAFFWPDASRASAQQVLRTTLSGLRKTLGAALVVSDESVALAADSEVDARAFEARLSPPVADAPRLTQTLDLYRGDFLSDFTLPGAPEFDDWAAVERERYRRLRVRGLMALSQLHEAARNYSAALDALDRALAPDPLQEDLQRAALRLHYLGGDRAGAIRRYEQFRRLLDDEMGVPPMAETRALYDAIITDTLAANPAPVVSASPARHPDTTPPASLPFVGRAAEMDALRALAAAGKLALIEGEPGIGKTRLAEEFIRASGALALIGRARELEQALPYQPVIEALRGLLRHPDWPALSANLPIQPGWWAEVARLLPELRSSSAAANPLLNEPVPLALAGGNESHLWEGLYQFLSALGRQRRVIFLLDDAHWADASTLALAGYLTRRGQDEAGAPVQVILTTRAVEVRSPLAALLPTLTREGRLGQLTLRRLSGEEVARLAKTLSQSDAQRLGDWLAQASEGNPYIVHELVREARAKNILRPDGVLNAEAFSASPVVPQSVYVLIQSRLAQLSDAARRVLDAAVAAGREFEFEVVARAVGLSEGAALDALDELRAADLMAPLDGLRFTFNHTLTMEVAYREAGEPRHRMLHRRMAEALEALYHNRLDTVAGLLAWHYIEGNAPERAAPYAFRAGQLAAQLPAWKEAIGFFEQALQAETDRGRRREILMALGEAHFAAGGADPAVEAFRAALDLALADGGIGEVNAARLALARGLFGQARYAESITLAQTVLASGDSDNAMMAEFAWGSALSVEGADLVGAAEHLQKAGALCDGQADPLRLAQIKFDLGGVRAQQGDLVSAIALYRESLDAARAPLSLSKGGGPSALWQALAHNNLGYHLHLLNDPGALEHAQTGLALAEEGGIIPVKPYLLSTLGEIALARNDLDAAEAYFTEGLALAERISAPERITGLTANLGRVAARRGLTALAVHRLSTALARADALGLQHLAAQIRLWLVPLLPPAEARAHLAEARAIIVAGDRRLLMQPLADLEAGAS